MAQSVAVPASPEEFDGSYVAHNSATAARATSRGSGPWGWSAGSRSWAALNGVLPASVVSAGPTKTITRGRFVVALHTIERIRHERYGTPTVLADRTAGATLKDVSPSSLGARAISLGWLAPVDGSFVSTRNVTANEAAVAMISVLGERPTMWALAQRLRQELPGARTVYGVLAAQTLIRTLGLRYNVLDPYDEFELGPREALNVGHGAYMMRVAAVGLESWRIDEARSLASRFDLPALGANERRILTTGIRFLGQPYVWGGETERMQAEGHGGFDCSGFTIRIVNQSGVASDHIRMIGERTTYTQSAIPRTQRIGRTKLRPADAVYFGSAGPKSLPSQNYHVGVYMGNGWFVHSSGGRGGVAIDTLNGWWGSQFSWGRRALRVR